MFQNLPHARRPIMQAQAHEPLQLQNHRKKQRQAEYVVQIIMYKRAANVVWLEIKATKGIKQQRRDANRIREIAEAL